MRKLVLVLALAGAAALLAFLALGGGHEAPPRGSAAVEPSAAPSAEAAPTSQQVAPRRAPSARSEVRPGAIEGRVIDTAGKPVARARVQARGALVRELDAGDDGAFSLRDLPPGDWTLLARAGVRASEPMGPVPLAPGEQLRELTLVLDVGGALSGTVSDAKTRKPVPDVQVRAASASAATDSRGHFRLEGLPAGRVTLEAEAKGYSARSVELDVVRGRERTGVDLALEQAARVHGKVLAGGVPVFGARVFAARYGFARRLSDRVPVAVSGQDGLFEGFVAPGRLELVAEVAGYAEGRTDELEVAAGDEREANISVGAGGAVLGRVTAGGEPVAGCRVAAFDAVHGREAGAGATGADGRYYVNALPPALYLVRASCESGLAEQAGITVGEGGEVGVDLALGAATIAGRVVDAQGRPVAAELSAKAEGSAAPGVPVAASGADGAFVLKGLAGSRFVITAENASGRAEARGVPAGAQGVTLVIGSAALSGRVVSDRGSPVTDFVVYAEPTAPGARPHSERVVSPTGEFRLPLAAGTWGVSAWGPGFVACAPVTVEPGSGADAKVTLTLASGATVSGRVVDPKGAPVAGARVASHPSMLWAFGRAAPIPAGAFAQAAGDGSFTLSGVQPGKQHLFAYADGYSQKQWDELDVPAGGTIGGRTLTLVPERQDVEKEFGGVGMSLADRDGHLFVADVFAGGPAREAGIRPGDILLTVDGAPAEPGKLGDTIGRIRGVVGTPVTLTLSRGGSTYTVAIARASVKF